MSGVTIEEQLLLGFLAVQNNFVSSDQFVDAVKTWLNDRSRSIRAVLKEERLLGDQHLNALDSLLELHLKSGSPNSQRESEQPFCNLAESESFSGLITELLDLNDPDVTGAIRKVKSSTQPLDPFKTVALEKPTSQAGREKNDAGKRYQVLRFHAKGGLGQVSLALDTELDRQVALKEIQTQFADDPASRTRFLLEARVNGNLQHPGIVPVYGFGKHKDGRPFYAMRYIEGQTFEAAIEEFHSRKHLANYSANLELRRLLSQFAQVCRAVAYAHTKRILHRDLKPSNIMLGPHGETLVVDWGLAKVLDSDFDKGGAREPEGRIESDGSHPTMHGTIIGTLAYMSPEQASGDADSLCPASDIFSLGATLYHLLTGKVPRTAERAAKLLEIVRDGRVLAPRKIDSTVSRPLESICLRAMRPQPEQRFETADELADEIEAFLADEPVASHQETLLERGNRWVRRNRSATISGLAALSLFAVVMTFATIVLNYQNQKFQLGLYYTLSQLSHLALFRGDAGALDEIFAEGFARCDESLRSWEYGFLLKSRKAEVNVFRIGRKGLSEAKITSDGRHLVCVTNDNKVEVWDPSQATKLWDNSARNDSIVACDILSVDDDCWVAIVESDGKTRSRLKVYSIGGQNPLATESFESPITEIQFTGDGSLIAAAKRAENIAGDAIVSVLNTADLKTRAQVECSGIWRIQALSATPDGTLLAVGGDGTVRADQPSSRGVFCLIDVEQARILEKQTGQYAVTSIKISPKNQELRVGYEYGFSEIWQLPLEENSRPFTEWNHEAEVLTFAYDAEGDWKAAGSYDRGIVLFGPLPYRSIRGHWSPVLAVAFNRDSSHIISVGSSGFVRVWDVKSAQNARFLPSDRKNRTIADSVFKINGDLLTLEVLSSNDSQQLSSWIEFYDINYDLMRKWTLPNIKGTALEVSDDGNQILVRDTLGSLFVVSEQEPNSTPLVSKIETEHIVNAAIFRDNQTIIIGTSNGKILTYDTSDKSLVLQGDVEGAVQTISTEPNKGQIGIGTEQWFYLWSKELQPKWKKQITDSPGRRCRFSRNGEMVALSTGGFGKSNPAGDLFVWNTAGKEIVRLRGEQDLFAGVNDVEFSRDSKRLFATTFDRRVILVRLPDGEQIYELTGHFAAVSELALSQDGRRLVTVSEIGEVLIQEADPWD